MKSTNITVTFENNSVRLDVKTGDVAWGTQIDKGDDIVGAITLVKGLVSHCGGKLMPEDITNLTDRITAFFATPKTRTAVVAFGKDRHLLTIDGMPVRGLFCVKSSVAPDVVNRVARSLFSETGTQLHPATFAKLTQLAQLFLVTGQESETELALDPQEEKQPKEKKSLHEAFDTDGKKTFSSAVGADKSDQQLLQDLLRSQKKPETWTEAQIVNAKQQRLQELLHSLFGFSIPFATPTARTLDTHQVNPTNKGITITAHSHQLYVVEGISPAKNPNWNGRNYQSTALLFQTGDPATAGINGITNETLLAVVKDRLESFQSGKFACIENQVSLNHINAALDTLLSRTRARQARGVEGTQEA